MLGATTTAHRRTAPTLTSSPPGHLHSAEPLSPWKRRIFFACSSPNFGSLTTRQYRRRCLQHSSCMVQLGHGADQQIAWDDFKNAFRAHYIPTGLIRRKAHEFTTLKQGNGSVEEYCKEFNRLALYALEQVDTPAKRKDHFLEGLSAELQDRLNLNMGGTFAEFVNNTIVTKDGYRKVMAERKRSASAMGPSGGPPQKFRMVYTDPSGQRYRSAPVIAPFSRPPQLAQQRP
ncbi:hypothetical protein PR202_ga21032 [Eleusine coracana subsp. coracana]|uniref:Retrotransposon gag domain-containing protein n=1 Tax=Eleusine coracana subsp. coracana TaxID=191504 RepID=A0AAV5CZB1_ELECO|nr:hypothetical protein PR202_ga21032 [Eleusine coracana subsp. coracana]